VALPIVALSYGWLEKNYGSFLASTQIKFSASRFTLTSCIVSFVYIHLFFYFFIFDIVLVATVACSLLLPLYDYPRESFREDYGITGVRLSVCLFVCLSVTTITK